MKIPSNYHSAFKDEMADLKELDFFSKNDCHVFYHNIIDGNNDYFKQCDFLYSEPAWRHGYDKFQNRAGVKESTHKLYLTKIRNIIGELNKPTFIVGGKHMIKTLSPNDYIEIKFNGFDAILMFWNTDVISVKTNIELLEILSKKYNTICDFSCGYGFYLKLFKKFICSDVNKKCVYFIAKTYMGYDK